MERIGTIKMIKPSCLSSTEKQLQQDKFEDTKVVIRSRKSKDRQYNGQEKKGQAMIYLIYTDNERYIDRNMI